MTKIANFGKIQFENSKSKCNEVTVEIDLNKNKDGLPVLSICGNVWNRNHTDIICGGQCLDTLKEYLGGNETFDFLYDMWKKHHLNDMHAGTPKQEEAVRHAKEVGLLPKHYDYGKACQYLKDANLFTDTYDGQEVKYGHSWLYYPIPESDLRKIEHFMEKGEVLKDNDKFVEQSDYDMVL